MGHKMEGNHKGFYPLIEYPLKHRLKELLAVAASAEEIKPTTSMSSGLWYLCGNSMDAKDTLCKIIAFINLSDLPLTIEHFA